MTEENKNKMFLVTLDAARSLAGYNQTEFAKKLGIPSTTLAGWEKNSSVISYLDVVKICNLCHILPDRIYFGRKSDFIRKVKHGDNML